MTVSGYMDLALEEAALAAKAGEVPVGAVIVDRDGNILARTHNRVVRDHDPTAHAEMLAIRSAAGNIANERLTGSSLYVTLEPCAMCAQAISLARVARLYYGAEDPKSGGVVHGSRVFSRRTCHHRPEIYGGIGEKRALKVLRDFFAKRR